MLTSGHVTISPQLSSSFRIRRAHYCMRPQTLEVASPWAVKLQAAQGAQGLPNPLSSSPNHSEALHRPTPPCLI
jgi:hypothetical protein